MTFLAVNYLIDTLPFDLVLAMTEYVVAQGRKLGYGSIFDQPCDVYLELVSAWVLANL
jgi:hypothetical protein